jgi:hypothetical protein
MKGSGFSYWVSLGAILLQSTAAFAANRGSLQIPEQVSVNGQSLATGDYQVKWDGDGPNVDLRILRDGKIVTTIPAHTIELHRKDSENSVLTKKSNDGKESLSEIHFGGKRYAFAVGSEQAQMNSSSADTR